MNLLRTVRTEILLTILLVALIATLSHGSRVGAVPAVAIIVYDHGLAEQIKYTKGHIIPTNKTFSFTQDDPFVYAYFTAAVSSANVTWLWYAPDGQLYLNATQQISCDSSPCTFVFDFRVGYTAVATMLGLWTLTLEAGGFALYTDHFYLTPVVTQNDFWNFDVIQSVPMRVKAKLSVTIHPQNETWSWYKIKMWDAANVTACDFVTNRSLAVTVSNRSEFVVNLGAPRRDGYTFVVSFDLRYGISPLWGLGGWDSGYFAFRWQESSWGTFDDGFHPVPGTFSITLPHGASIVDTVGINELALDQNLILGLRPTLSFVTTLPPTQTYGWVVIYRDLTYANSNLQTTSSIGGGLNWSFGVGGLNAAQAEPIAILPLTVGRLSIWTAVLSILLLTGSELLSPVYARTGVIVNRRRLRIAALILLTLFLVTAVYQLIAITQPVSVAH